MQRIALNYDARMAYDCKVMMGVAAYLRGHTDYSISIEGGCDVQRLSDLRSWDGDGMIANLDHPLVLKAAAQSKSVVVGFGGGGGNALRTGVPFFFSNNHKIAIMAADHLLDRGFRKFAYCGYARSAFNVWSAERGTAFVSYLRRRGFDCAVYHDLHKTIQPWASVEEALAGWVDSLPKPVGIMAANDNRGRELLEACRTYGWKVPGDVAVLGVDNDELLCQLSSLPLSSIEHGARQIGYEAAALLDRLMLGGRAGRRRFVFDPLEVVTRQSTDVLAIDDPIVAKAMAFIQGHAFEGINVPHVMSAVAVSRSKLEAHFAKSLGHSVHAAIRKVQLERARSLIAKTDLPLKQVAANVGLRSVQHMTTLFGVLFGQPPGRYRKNALLGARPEERHHASEGKSP